MTTHERVVLQNSHWTGSFPPVYPFKRHLFSKIERDLETKFITYLTGPRRCGKSIILKQLMTKLLTEKVFPQQILFFEFAPTDSKEVFREVAVSFLQETADPTKRRYLFLDELQYVDDYISVLKEIYDNNEDLKIFVTGSLSLFYKRKMEDSLAGRYFAYRLFPLNFSEYLELKNSPLFNEFNKILSKDPAKRKVELAQLDREFRQFLRYGRLPEMVNLLPEQQDLYLQSIINQSLTNDAFNYFSIEKPQVILAIYAALRNNNGAEISLLSLAKNLQISVETVGKYLEILDIMGLCYPIFNSLSPTAKLNSRRKYYTSSHLALFEPKYDLLTATGFAVEGYVLERLLEKGETVTFYRQRQKEVDFVLPKKKQAVEVKYRERIENVDKVLPDYELQVITPYGNFPACLA